ncbi:hypothetical protein M072_0372 [Bacteroides fragilis str. DS-208]|nr:hypothetical protein M072_0372 [Bacteroides fragilis str. DS-208]
MLFLRAFIFHPYLPSSTLHFSKGNKRNLFIYSTMSGLFFLFIPIKAFCFP